MKSAITHHGNRDWCHLCGIRSDKLADIWFPSNAEHDEAVNPGPVGLGRSYIRICSMCALVIDHAARGTCESGK